MYFYYYRTGENVHKTDFTWIFVPTTSLFRKFFFFFVIAATVIIVSETNSTRIARTEMIEK